MIGLFRSNKKIINKKEEDTVANELPRTEVYGEYPTSGFTLPFPYVITQNKYNTGRGSIKGYSIGVLDVRTNSTTCLMSWVDSRNTPYQDHWDIHLDGWWIDYILEAIKKHEEARTEAFLKKCEDERAQEKLLKESQLQKVSNILKEYTQPKQ